ncbi:MAG: hypothetical protein GKR87_11685 [Kiritimatiellae bacterium]|nr:hypothetical protein [Kiritimatiellia bacterium]
MDLLNTEEADIVVVDILSEADCGSSLCQGKEIVAGSVIYGLDISLGMISVVRNLNVIDPAVPAGSDGPAGVGDLDGDPSDLEVAYADTANFYIWSPKKQQSLFRRNGIVAFSGALPAHAISPIANYYDDTQDGFTNLSEVVFITANTVYSFNLNHPLEQWSFASTDASGITRASAYDLDNDGVMEILYRGELNLRIINGKCESTGES